MMDIEEVRRMYDGYRIRLPNGSNCLGLGSRGAARTSLFVCVLAKVLSCLVQRRTMIRDVRDTDEVSALVR